MSPKVQVIPYSTEGLQPYAATILEFLSYLEQRGAKGGRLTQDARTAWHLLTWLERQRISPTILDDAVLHRFLDHDCRCPRPPYRRAKAYKKLSYRRGYPVFWFVRFLEETGRVSTLGELQQNLEYLDEFLGQKSAAGYTQRAFNNYRRQCRHFIFWLHHCRIPLVNVDEGVLRQFAGHKCICTRPGLVEACKFRSGRISDTSFQVQLFVKFLIERGIVAEPETSIQISDDGLEEFRSWLRQERGITERTIQNYIWEVLRLLPNLGCDPHTYNAEVIRNALLQRLSNVSPTYAGDVTQRLRMYVRYLVTVGKCPPSLLGAIPSVPHPRLATLPRYISPKEIERVIGCCTSDTPRAIRDRAVVLLLARLGLRAGDIVNMEIDDVDWNSASIKVQSKTRQESSLPLPQDVGDALLDYLLNARPRTNEKKIFLATRAPHRPLCRARAISRIAHAALDRAEIEKEGSRGAYVFRHSAATNMLRAGATLNTVGALLRHRSQESTAIYAKVDVEMLRQVAQPWIGGDTSC